jgi:hypothetical protein
MPIYGRKLLWFGVGVGPIHYKNEGQKGVNLWLELPRRHELLATQNINSTRPNLDQTVEKRAIRLNAVRSSRTEKPWSGFVFAVLSLVSVICECNRRRSSEGDEDDGLRRSPRYAVQHVLSIVCFLGLLPSAASADTKTTTLTVKIEPQAAIAAGAKWTVNDRPPMLSGYSIVLPRGSSYKISFTDVSGFATPRALLESPGIAAASLTGTYSQPAASVTVDIRPPQAGVTGAQWNVDGGSGQPSGATVSCLANGQHTINFIAGNGSTAPPNQSIYLIGNQTATVTGTFTVTGTTSNYQSGSLTVTIDPTAVAAGAMWSVDGEGPLTSGTTLDGLSVGNHLVSFGPANGLYTPPDQTIAINNMQAAIVSGTYDTDRNARSLLKMASPDGKFQLLIAKTASPEDTDQVVTSFAITDARGEIIANLGYTEWPIVGVKWHKSAHSALVLEHLARADEMYLITKQGGIWQKIAVTQFEKPPDSYYLIDAESALLSFKCYYLGYDISRKVFTAYSTEVNAVSGEAALKSARQVKNEDVPFYKQDIGGVLFQLKSQLPADQFPHFDSSRSDDEPEWFGTTW